MQIILYIFIGLMFLALGMMSFENYRSRTVDISPKSDKEILDSQKVRKNAENSYPHDKVTSIVPEIKMRG